jgi:hypothetical protein
VGVGITEVEYVIHEDFLDLSHVDILPFPILLLLAFHHLLELLKIEELFYCLDGNPQADKSILQGLANVRYLAAVHLPRLCPLLGLPLIGCYLGALLVLPLFLRDIDTLGHYLAHVLVVVVS